MADVAINRPTPQPHPPPTPMPRPHVDPAVFYNHLVAAYEKAVGKPPSDTFLQFFHALAKIL